VPAERLKDVGLVLSQLESVRCGAVELSDRYQPVMPEPESEPDGVTLIDWPVVVAGTLIEAVGSVVSSVVWALARAECEPLFSLTQA
jgi:hypothetical protein